jgi:hypothetical protein
MHTSSSTGSSDSEQTALAVIPAGRPSYVVVTIVTPVAKCAIASRNAISSTVGSDTRVKLTQTAKADLWSLRSRDVSQQRPIRSVAVDS